MQMLLSVSPLVKFPPETSRFLWEGGELLYCSEVSMAEPEEKGEENGSHTFTQFESFTNVPVTLCSFIEESEGKWVG